MLQLKSQFDFSDSTPLLAMLLFDKFMTMHQDIEEVLLPLIAVTCLGLSEKMLERKRKCSIQQCQDEKGQVW